MPIMLEAASEILSSDDTEDEENNDAAFTNNDYLKKLYKRIKAWLSDSSSQRQPSLIVVDDATTLATETYSHERIRSRADVFTR